MMHRVVSTCGNLGRFVIVGRKMEDHRITSIGDDTIVVVVQCCTIFIFLWQCCELAVYVLDNFMTSKNNFVVPALKFFKSVYRRLLAVTYCTCYNLLSSLRSLLRLFSIEIFVQCVFERR